MNNKIIFIILIIVAIGGGAYFGISQQEKFSTDENFITYKDFGLTDREKQGYFDEISKTEQKLNELGGSASKEDTYKYNLHIGVQYYGLGEYLKAKKYYENAAKALPGNPVPLAELFVVENAMRDYKNAEKHLRKAIELNPGAPQYWRWLLELREFGFFDTQDKLDLIYKDALVKTQENIDIIRLYAQFLEKRGDILGSTGMWRKAIEKNPADKALYEAEIKRIQDNL